MTGLAFLVSPILSLRSRQSLERVFWVLLALPDGFTISAIMEQGTSDKGFEALS